ncbi:NAD(P)H-quinone oxidoreductase subunit 4L, chloroplastic [bioreactor metagenome]|uniref:NAD(P)H-quinone oxidoreductase subunit 4L, chloroplastic n=1 Tax=bioreactor metagenome TaxID=1076179 RepID=A0A645E3Q4_9ZZZZ|nr:NADH-quinone oxidoreductase subunit K [Anaerolineaceae bacterium]
MNLPIPFIVALTILGLAGIGMYCLLASRNLIRVIVGLQLLIKGVALAFVLGGNMSGNVNLGQTLGLTVIVADTIVAVVGLSMAVQIRHRLGTLDVKELSSLKR